MSSLQAVINMWGNGYANSFDLSIPYLYTTCIYIMASECTPDIHTHKFLQRNFKKKSQHKLC